MEVLVVSNQYGAIFKDEVLKVYKVKDKKVIFNAIGLPMWVYTELFASSNLEECVDFFDNYSTLKKENDNG